MGAVRSPEPDNQYNKAILKGEIKLTKLNAENFQSWSEGMQLLLAAKKLWRLVKGTEKKPDPITRPNDHEAWVTDDDQAKAWIYVNLEDAQHNHIRGQATSHDMWEALRKVHGALGQGRLNFLKRKFFNYKAGPSESIDDVSSELSRLQLIIRDIKDTEAPTDLDVALTLINSVDDEAYTLAKYHLEEMENLTLAHTKERLKSVEQRLKDDQASDEKANRSGPSVPGQGPRKEERECHHCKKKGHLKRQCFKWLQTDEGKKFKENKKNQEEQQDQPDKPANQKGRGTSQVSRGRKSSRGGGRARTAQDIEEETDDEALMARDATGRDLPQQDVWVIDSGASRHMTPDESLFSTSRPINTTVTVANGEVLRACSIGEVKVPLGGRTVKMKEVLHVPGLDANLLSISALNRRGFSVFFGKKTVEIRSGDTLIATGVLQGRMYLLRSAERALLTSEVNGAGPISSEILEPATSVSGSLVGAPPKLKESKSSSPKGSSENQARFRLWHERLGHVGPGRLEVLEKYVSGLGTIEAPDQHICEICDYTKLTRKINRETATRASRRLGRVHTDVWGPYKTPSLGGSRYFLSLIDDLTRKSWILFLKTRSEIYEKFREWDNAVGLETGEKAAIFRADNAREYQKLEKLVRTRGTHFEFTTPYTPEQSGVAERFNRTVTQMARAMLLWAELPHQFWGEAVATANYLRNLMPAGQDQEKSPNELWTGTKPDISHIRKFGCLVHVHIPRESRSKLDRVSFQGIFVGYHSSTQVRVYHPGTQKIQWHTAVKFLEDTPGGRLLKNSQVDEAESPLNFGDDDEDDEDEIIEFLDPEIQEDQPIPTNQIAPTRRNRATPGPPTRRSTRMTKPFSKYRFDNEKAMIAPEPPNSPNFTNLPDQKFEPTTYKEAIACREQRLWKVAISEQLNALIANKTWELVRRPADASNIITSKWVFKVKYTQTGHVDRYKARLVARGFSQVQGVDYEETFSPTLRMESLRMLLALAAHFRYEIEQMDVPDAYLKGDLKETIYMKIPDGYDIPNSENQVLRLLRPLYGLKQSGREWNAKAKGLFRSMGFMAINSDCCVFLNQSEPPVIIALYVDDLLIFSDSPEAIDKVKKQLFREFKMKDMGPATYILGIRIRRSANRTQLAIDQSTYIRKFLHEYGMGDATAISHPIDGYHSLTPAQPDEPRTDQREYQQRIGSMMYAMIGTRPDIAYAIGKLSQYCQDPSVRHRTAIDRVLRYLKGTVDLALLYDGTANPICYGDASYGDDATDRKSTYGHTLIMGNAAVIWASKKQRTISTSTVEAEYVSMCQASKTVVWASRWMRELFGDFLKTPIELLGDNQGSLDLIKNPENHSRTKHIDVQYHYIREVVQDGLMRTGYVSTKEMIADILTKPTKPAIFLMLRKKLGLTEVRF